MRMRGIAGAQAHAHRCMCAAVFSRTSCTCAHTRHHTHMCTCVTRAHASACSLVCAQVCYRPGAHACQHAHACLESWGRCAPTFWKVTFGKLHNSFKTVNKLRSVCLNSNFLKVTDKLGKLKSQRLLDTSYFAHTTGKLLSTDRGKLYTS